MPAGSGGYGHFDLGVGAREGFQVGFEEGAIGEGFRQIIWTSSPFAEELDSLHSSAATGPVAVVEVQALALENEGADAVLGEVSAKDQLYVSAFAYLWLCHCAQSCEGHVDVL